MQDSKILIDWIGVTCTLKDPVGQLCGCIPYDRASFVALPSGGLGYKQAMTYLSATIYYDGGKDMGAHLRITGQGCRALEAHDINLFAWCAFVVELEGMTFTRLDIACDTSRDILSPTVDCLAQGLYSSKARKVNVISSAGPDGLTASTCYIGSRQSGVYIRIYDKAAERGLSSVDWYRAELEIKKGYIDKAIALTKASPSKAFADIIGTYFRPLKKRIKPITRSPTADWWVDFLGEVERVSLVSDPRLPTIESKYAWLQKQAAPTIALLSKAFGSDAWIKALDKEGERRLREIDWRLIDAWRCD